MFHARATYRVRISPGTCALTATHLGCQYVGMEVSEDANVRNNKPNETLKHGRFKERKAAESETMRSSELGTRTVQMFSLLPLLCT